MSPGQRCVCFGIVNSLSLLLKARVWDRVWSHRFIITVCCADRMFQPKINHLLRSTCKKRVCDCVACSPVRLLYQHVSDVLCVALLPWIQAGTRREKKCFTTCVFLIILQDVWPYLVFRKSFRRRYERVDGIITQLPLVSFLWVINCWGNSNVDSTRTHSDELD